MAVSGSVFRHGCSSTSRGRGRVAVGRVCSCVRVELAWGTGEKSVDAMAEEVRGKRRGESSAAQAFRGARRSEPQAHALPALTSSPPATMASSITLDRLYHTRHTRQSNNHPPPTPPRRDHPTLELALDDPSHGQTRARAGGLGGVVYELGAEGTAVGRTGPANARRLATQRLDHQPTPLSQHPTHPRRLGS